MRFKNKMSWGIALDLGIFIFYCLCFFYQISSDNDQGNWLPEFLCRPNLIERNEE